MDGENPTYNIAESSFDGLYDGEDESDTLKRDIVYERYNITDGTLSSDEINDKYDDIKNSEGKLSNIYYVSDTLGGENHKFLYDSSTGIAIQVPAEKIAGKSYHIARTGSAEVIPSAPDIEIPKPTDPDFTNHVSLEDTLADINMNWIPIFNVDDYRLIGSEQTDYRIYDLDGQYVGIYTMAKNANYRLMNDITFTISPNSKSNKTTSGFCLFISKNCLNISVAEL